MKTGRTPLFLFAVPAVFITLGSTSHSALLYDRAAILRGEWWRLWTGHWVHFSVSHLAWNLLVIFAAAPWLERLQRGLVLRYTLMATPAISVALLFLAPAMQNYGGLSGLATGLVVLLALEQISRREAGAAWWMGLLALVVGKIACEMGNEAAVFSRFADDTIRPSAAAHIAGAGLALAFFLSRRAGACLPLGNTAPVRVATPEKSPR